MNYIRPNTNYMTKRSIKIASSLSNTRTRSSSRTPGPSYSHASQKSLTQTITPTMLSTYDLKQPARRNAGMITITPSMRPLGSVTGRKRRTVNVAENGVYQKEGRIETFSYRLPRNNVCQTPSSMANRLKKFFDFCQMKFKRLGTQYRFKHLFCEDGREVKSLEQIPTDCETVYVSRGPYFEGQRKFCGPSERGVKINRITTKTLKKISSGSTELSRFDCRSQSIGKTPKRSHWASTVPTSLASSPQTKKSSIWARLDSILRASPDKNLRSLEAKYQVPRSELQNLYEKYKSILSIAEKLHIQKGDKKSESSQAYIAASEKILLKLFEIVEKNQDCFIDWKEFLVSMMILRCGNWSEKINFFYKLFDDEEGGFVSIKEIEDVFMEKILGVTGPKNKAARQIAKAKARAIYDWADIPYDKLIGRTQVKDVITGNGGDKDLIEVFVAYDVESGMQNEQHYSFIEKNLRLQASN